MTAGDDVHHRSRRHASSRASAIRRPRCRCTSRSTASGPDVQAVVHAHPPIATGFAVAGIPLDRAVLAEVVTTLGSVPIAEYATPSTKELPEAVRKYIKAHDGMLLANHGALTLGADLFRPTTRWRRSSTSPRSAWWRGCSAASACCRARRSSGCRGCAAPTGSPRRRRSAPTLPAADRLDCQVVRRRRRRPSGWSRRALAAGARRDRPGEEIRLTYSELTALIEDAQVGK